MEFLKPIEDFLINARSFYWSLALIGSAIFLIQLAMTFLGFGDQEVDTDIDGDGDVSFGEHSDSGLSDFKFFSFRAIIAFITFLGWGGVLWGRQGWSGFAIAMACGIGMMFVTGVLILMMMRLAHSGNITSEQLIGCTGTVYLSIPSGRDATGKVTVKVAGCTKQVKAVADEEIPTGASIQVDSQVDAMRFLVKRLGSHEEPIDSPIEDSEEKDQEESEAPKEEPEPEKND